MAKAQGRTTAKTAKHVALDTSFEHPSLTPKMRRLAGELWTLVQAKAAAEEFPITSARLRAETDMENVTWVIIHAKCHASSDETFAFEERLNPDYERWADQLDDEHREFKDQPHLHLYWIPAARTNGGV